MPLYTFRNKKTGRSKEYRIKLADYDKFKEDHPNLERIIDPIVFNYSSGGAETLSVKAAKKDKGWKEVLTKIGEQNPHSPLAQEFHRNKSIDRIKAEIVVDKHAKKQSASRAQRGKKK